MNRDFDAFAGCLALIEALGRAERCRLVDRVMADMGNQVPMEHRGDAPVAEFEDIRADARWWCENVPAKTRAIYVDQIFLSLSKAERHTLIQWMKNRVDELTIEEGQKAEPESG